MENLQTDNLLGLKGLKDNLKKFLDTQFKINFISCLSPRSSAEMCCGFS